MFTFIYNVDSKTHYENPKIVFGFIETNKMNIFKTNTVKPVLRGHLWGSKKLALQDRWPLKRGSIHMKFSMTEMKKVPLNTGDCMGRFDCIYILHLSLLNHYIKRTSQNVAYIIFLMHWKLVWIYMNET